MEVGGKSVHFGLSSNDGPHLPPIGVCIMSEPLTPELEAKAQELARRIQIRSQDTILDIARQLVATPEEKLFGSTELAIRDATLRITADAYAERIEKKEAPPPAASTAPTATTLPPSTATATKRS